MLRRLSLRDVAIVATLELDFDAGFTALTGETGAGKSILVDALQLALGSRADAGRVREGAARAEVAAEFDTPGSLQGWLDDGGFDAGPTLLLRRTVDGQGRSRAWINGSPATVAQLREAAEHLVDIHGQHAWQSLTRPVSVRALLDAQAGVDEAALGEAWKAWQAAERALERARQQRDTLAQERERLAWQLGEIERLAPGEHEWDELNAEHQRLSHAQALLEGARAALDALSDGEPAAGTLLAHALDALDDVTRYDADLEPVAVVLRDAQALLQDAAHTLGSYLGRREPDPQRLAALDERLSAWIALARRHRRAPSELPALWAQWRQALGELDASADLQALEGEVDATRARFIERARTAGQARRRAAPALAREVTQAMQQLGMAGGRLEVALEPLTEPQSWGLEDVELRFAGHAGSAPRPLARIASGGELSRLALAVAVSTVRPGGTGPATLVFDEIDAGVGGAVGDAVGRLMKQLGAQVQVLAVTHLAQVAASADHHVVVDKQLQDGRTTSRVTPVAGQARVREIARMLGGDHLDDTRQAHAAAMLRSGSGNPGSTSP